MTSSQVLVRWLLPCLVAGAWPAAAAWAQWSTDAGVNTAICTTATLQQATRGTSDGLGGAIITWWEYDVDSSDYDIRAQRINVAGQILWPDAGAAICTHAALSHVPEIISDGAGGAIIAWQDNRSGVADIYAQRINGTGTVLWTLDGVAVCDTSRDQTSVQLIPDGLGGAILTWRDLRSNSNYHAYAQRISADGQKQWANQGVLLAIDAPAEGLQLTSDGSGGAIVVWHQYMSGSGQFDIYAQRVLATGFVAWGGSGISLCGLNTSQYRPQIASDGRGGAIVVWEDFRNVTYSNLYAQRIDSLGSVAWSVNGLAVAPGGLNQIRHQLEEDGAGGVLIAWEDSQHDIHAQHLDSLGLLAWGASGVPVSSVGEAWFPAMVRDGGRGAIIAWHASTVGDPANIFAQRVDSAGTLRWNPSAVEVSAADSGQTAPSLVADGQGGCIVAWDDERSLSSHSIDTYAQWVSSNGTLGVATGTERSEVRPADFELAQNTPNPFNPSTTIAYVLPVSSRVTLEVFNVLGQRVTTLHSDVDDPGRHAVTFAAPQLASGVYYYRLRAQALDRRFAQDFVATRALLLLR